MSTTPRLIVAAALVVGFSFAGCDQQSPPPAAGGGGGGGGGAGSGQTQTTTSGTAGSAEPGGPVGGVRQQPKSSLGRTADMARDARQGIQDRQAEALAAANEMTGEGQALEFNGVKFVAPAGWQKVPPQGSMRAAELKAIAPDMEPEVGTCSIVVFTFKPGEGGNVQMNIDRWTQQFKADGGEAAEPEVGRREISGLPVTTVALEGTYSEMMPSGAAGQSRRGWAFRAAIVESSRGNVIVRLTGPREAVNALQGDWARMIDGMTR